MKTAAAFFLLRNATSSMTVATTVRASRTRRYARNPLRTNYKAVQDFWKISVIEHATTTRCSEAALTLRISCDLWHADSPTVDEREKHPTNERVMGAEKVDLGLFVPARHEARA